MIGMVDIHIHPYVILMPGGKYYASLSEGNWWQDSNITILIYHTPFNAAGRMTLGMM